MQKALTQMNIQLANVISDLSGVTGQLIVRAIIAGERDPWKLAELRHPRIQASRAEIAKSLEGNWRPELIFVPQCSQTVQPRLSCRSSYDTVTLGPPTPFTPRLSPGPQGLAGPIGPQGLQGPPDANGLSGGPGPQGPVGLQGATGLVNRGNWFSSIAYRANEAVFRSASWLAIFDNSTLSPPPPI